MGERAWWTRGARTAPWIDVALCGAVLVVGVVGQAAASGGAEVDSMSASPAGITLALIASGALWWRRAWPLLTLCGEVIVLMVAAGVSQPGLFVGQAILVIGIACFAAGAWSERRWVMAGLGTVLMLALIAGSLDDGKGFASAAAAALALVALPMVAGVAARSRRRYLEEVEHRLAEAEQRQDERAQLAIQEEHTRIARELHDVVAHHVSLIGVQAGAARATLDSSSDATRDALTAIESSSRAAVGEMRRIVEVLRPLDVSRSPQPGLADLGPLLDRWRGAGFVIDAEVAGLADVGELPPGLSLSCYRVVEESLTNVARHSAARSASVRVRRTAESTIEIDVQDPGPSTDAGRDAGPSPTASAEVGGGGRGLVGMAERCALFGGTVEAVPQPDGGFWVRASIPIGAQR